MKSTNQVPKLALGTWLMGGTKDPDPDNDDDADKAVIQLAVNEGVTLIDTSQNYANGRCEEIVAEALVGIPRSSYQLLTKQKQQRLAYQNVIDDCESSLARLKTDYLDYFVCHAPNTDFDMKDFFRAANLLYEQGKIRNVGVSNFGPHMLALAIEQSTAPIQLNQVHVSLDDDDVFATGTYDFCVKHDITVQAYRAIGNLDANPAAVAELDALAHTHDVSRQQMAIAYLNSYPGMAFTIRASSKGHWDDIKEALDIKLKQADLQKLRATHQNITGMFGHYLKI